MKRYKYALIDGNWVLHRNFCAMGGVSGTQVAPGFAENLASSVLSSFMKITSEFLIEKIIILWDTPPYFKQRLLNNSYKENRYHMDEETAAEIEDPNERAKALIDAYNFKQRGIAKSKLKSLGCLGLPSIFRTGYEADDLAYLLSNYRSKLQESVLLISIDSDWKYWLNPCCDLYNPKSDVVVSYEDVVVENNLPDGMSLFRFKSLYDSFYGSHNDLVQTVTDEIYQLDYHDAFKLFDQLGYSDEIFADKNLARAQVESFNFESQEDYKHVLALAESMSIIGSLTSPSGLAELSNELLIDINVASFSHYYSTLNKELFKE